MHQAQFRNIFHFEEESSAWKSVISSFPNKVPRFATKDEAGEFILAHSAQGSNPDYPFLQHSISTLIDWNQIKTHLIPKILEYDSKWKEVEIDTHSLENRFLGEVGENVKITNYLKSRLSLSVHHNLSLESTMNTLKYLFFHMKCGIYVMIRNNQVVIFCPFVNKDYVNTWGSDLKIDSEDGSLEQYYDEKSKHCRKENIIQDTSQWWANGNIICNEYKKDDHHNQYWGDHFLFQLKDMFSEACNHRTIPDCEFFINKRDYPQLKYNNSIFHGGIPVEPYGFIYDRDDRDPNQDIPLSRHFYKSYTPIMSFYSSDRFADIPIPPTEDWESATGMVYPASFSTSMENGKKVPMPSRDLFTAINLKKFERKWEDKIPVAFFRGTATGGGVTVETNQRLALANTSYYWSLDTQFNGQNKQINHGYPYLDAKITGWNLRDKKISNNRMTYVRPSSFPFDGDKAKNYVEIYKQATYKYLLYVEGHCAACRYGFMMQLGSVILKVESRCVADSIWYFPLLQPYIDHIPIKADLSDLQEKLEWCHQHDKECEQIALNAKKLYEQYISRDGILDYIQAICIEIHEKYKHVSKWVKEVPEDVTVPKRLQQASMKKYCTKDNEMCLYCEDSIKHEEEQNKRIRLSSGGQQVRIMTQNDEKKRKNQELKKRMHQLANNKVSQQPDVEK